MTTCGEIRFTISAQIGIVFQTVTPFDTPHLMTELVTWVNQECIVGC